MFQKPLAAALGLAALATCVGIVVAASFPAEATPEPALPAAPVPLDQFAGKTVKNVAMGLEVMRSREANCPQPGTLAPDFELLTKDGESTVRLSDMRGGKPIVLIFGSYT